MDEELKEQTGNSKPWLYKKGQSGNPAGRPKGSKSMKTWVKDRLLAMNEEEREAFLEGIPKVDIWKLAEGNPKQDNEINATVTTMSLSELFLKTQDDNQ